MRYFSLVLLLLTITFAGIAQTGPNPNALKALTKGDLRGAIQILDNDIKDRKNLSENFKFRADLKRMTGDFQGAFQDTSEAIAIKPDGQLYRNRAELRSILQQESASVLSDLDMAVAAGLKHERVYTSRASIKRSMGDTKGAIDDYKIAMGLNPAFVQSYVGLSSVYRQEKNQEQAIEVLENFIRSYEQGTKKVAAISGSSNVVSSVELPSRSSKDAVMGQETVVLMNGMPTTGQLSPQELQRFSERMENARNTALAYTNLAQLYEEKMLYPQALLTVEKSMAIDPSDFYSLQVRGTIRIGLKDYTGALEDLNRAIAKAPTMPLLYRTRGLANLMLNRNEEAEADFARFLSRFPTAKDELERRKALAFRIRDGQ